MRSCCRFLTAERCRTVIEISRKDAIAAGLKRYCTGKPCRLGHVAERKVHNRHCVACANAEAVATRLAKPDRVRARDRAWRAANLDEHRSRDKAYYHANIAKRLASQAKWREANRDYLKAKYRETFFRWRIYQATRRGRIRAAGGAHTAEQIADLLIRQKGKCPWCRATLKLGFHIDHHMPIAMGGTNDISNIRLLCEPCNRRKSAKHPVSWAQSLGMLL